MYERGALMRIVEKSLEGRSGQWRFVIESVKFVETFDVLIHNLSTSNLMEGFVEGFVNWRKKFRSAPEDTEQTCLDQSYTRRKISN